MLHLIKKSDATTASAPQWHPNFRNFERLPDTKVVRTTFFINVTAITIAACLVIMLGYRTYRIHELNLQVEETQAVIDKNTKDNAEAVRLTKVFDAETMKISEALVFIKRSIVPSELLMFLGSSLPKEVQIESIDLKFSGASGDQCVLSGIVAGSKDEASGSANKYVEMLSSATGYSSKFASVKTEALNTDPSGGYMRFKILIKLKPAGKEM